MIGRRACDRRKVLPAPICAVPGFEIAIQAILRNCGLAQTPPARVLAMQQIAYGKDHQASSLRPAIVPAEIRRTRSSPRPCTIRAPAYPIDNRTLISHPIRPGLKDRIALLARARCMARAQIARHDITIPPTQPHAATQPAMDMAAACT